jgi:hypothetical protein
MHSNYLKTDGFDGPNGTGDDFVAGGRVSTPTLCHTRLSAQHAFAHLLELV